MVRKSPIKIKKYKKMKDLKKLQKKVNKFSEEVKEEIYGICEQLQYIDSSRFSYNIDRLEQFRKELNEFKIQNQ